MELERQIQPYGQKELKSSTSERVSPAEVVQEGEFTRRTATFTKTPSDDEGSGKENHITDEEQKYIIVQPGSLGIRKCFWHTHTRDWQVDGEKSVLVDLAMNGEKEEKLDYLKQSMQQ